MLSVGHECLGARQTQGGHANATRADSSRQQTADSRQQLARMACDGAAGHHRHIGNQRARALPACPLAPPLDTRSQSSTFRRYPDDHKAALSTLSASHTVCLLVPRGPGKSSTTLHAPCAIWHSDYADESATSSSSDHKSWAGAPPATQGAVPARTTHVKLTRPRCASRHHRQGRRVLPSNPPSSP
jgi:hypothetical protein